MSTQASSKFIYKFECLRCARCCKTLHKILILKRDIRTWRRFGCEAYLKNIQICPNTISPKRFRELNERGRERLIQFILKNHEYRGEEQGSVIENSCLDRDWGNRPILRPRSFEIALKGMNWGLDYRIITEFHNQCPYLIKENICQIQDLKPYNCQLFPYNRFHELRTDKFVLEICKGIKKIEL